MTAVSVGLTCTVLGADDYSVLAAQGYRWVTVNGPYACNTEQNENMFGYYVQFQCLDMRERLRLNQPRNRF